jgi:hypothetical protein
MLNKKHNLRAATLWPVSQRATHSSFCIQPLICPMPHPHLWGILGHFGASAKRLSGDTPGGYRTFPDISGHFERHGD